ncbi:hypothetical protein LUZ60_009535 [Juncus effusus]|nr:hypothetical protein LUZ60_009535 [Juncus effusus]
MDDSCAVCAEALEWVAYGACGHREVCSTCVVRLRFVLNDKRCCICKSDCPSVFVTKAMGDYTRVITDFSAFPAANTEGQTGAYWYHEDTQAYFDDSDQYKMIRAMCRLSCSVCDKAGAEEVGPGARRRNRFRSIEQLKGHLFHQHRLFMCSLCLEGRKIFICEQKLYTRLQLNQHIKSGDSEVDGSESERSGFSGHPLCEFCKSPFYGDNELYMHMSTEHYTCHICQRQHPGQYDYFRNYDDLETHFREAHFLCGSDDCLAKKFVVFQNEQELKRHNALEHGGNMSRAQRNAALQIPTSFRYRRSEQEQRARGGRGRNSNNFFRDTSSSDQDSSLDPVHDAPINSLANSISSTSLSEHSSFPPLYDSSRTGSTTDQSDSAARYALALNQNSRGATALIESSFPPLPGAAPVRNPGTSAIPQQGLQSLARHHAWQRRRPVGTVKVVKPRLTENRVVPPSFPSLQSQNINNNTGAGTSTGSSSSMAKVKQPTISNNMNQAGPSSSNPKVPNGVPVPIPVPVVPPLPVPVQENVKNANKSLVERIRAGLNNDEERFDLFKSISAEYRKGDMGTLEYLSCVEQFQLSHLVPELASLLPDKQKQRELTEAYYTNLRFKNLTESSKNGNNGSSSKNASGSSNNSKGSKKGKGKDTKADEFLDTVRKLQSNQRSNEEERTEVLSKDGYRASSNKGKSVISLSGESSNNNNNINITSKTHENENKLGEGGTSGGAKQKNKKTSKFLRARLGDGSVAALFDPNRKDPSPEKDEKGTGTSGNNGTVRGVWRNGGGQKLAKDLFK